MRFRKKPVVIEARQLTPRSLADIKAWVPNSRERIGCLVIPTLEGDHLAESGDWIICGVKGEFYPCKPDIFEATYEPADEPFVQGVA